MTIYAAKPHASTFHPRAGVWEEKPRKESRPRKAPAKSYFAQALESAIKLWAKK